MDSVLSATVIGGVVMSIGDVSANERTGSMTFNVVLSKPHIEEINVDWATSALTATAGSDYTSASGTLTFNARETRKTITVAIGNDVLLGEEDETFQVTLSNPRPTGKVWFTRRQATGHIDDDSDNPSRSVNNQGNPPEKVLSKTLEIPEIPSLPPITASFIGMPSEHNGSDTFTFELRFSENIKGFSYKTLKNNGAFQVTNGSIKNARRLARPANQLWEITVQPSNNNNISISLPPTTNCSASGAICDSDGRKLSNGVASFIQGPVGISVADASANENTASTVDFTVSLFRSSTRSITVNYTTQDGTATAGQDYTSKSGTLTFTAGQTSKTVSVSLLNDSIDEGNETFTLRLSNPSNAFLADSEATGTIENSDPMPKAWLSRFGRTVGGQAVEAISSRMGKTSEENRVVIGGVDVSEAKNIDETPQAIRDLQSWNSDNEPSLQHWNGDPNLQGGLLQGGQNTQTMSVKELLKGTSFNLGVEEPKTKRFWSAWGQFLTGGFNGQEDGLNLDGQVTSGFIGTDLTVNNWRTGIAFSNSRGTGNFNLLDKDSPVDNSGTIESEMFGLYPYLGYNFGEDKALWGIIGLGEGDMSITVHSDKTLETGISMQMGAVGAKGQRVPFLDKAKEMWLM